MNGEPLDSRPRGGYSPAILAIAAIIILGLAALLIFRPWASGDNEQLALVIRSAATATRVPSATPTPGNSPSPSATKAAATHTPEATATSTPEPIAYEVEAGDTLGAIAKAYGISVAALTEANQIEVDGVLRVGQVLIIPQESETGPAQVAANVTEPTVTPLVENVSYEIQAGDTLGAIAKAYDVSVADITEVNRIEEDDVLRVGQVIFIPIKSGAKTPGATAAPANATPTPLPVELGQDRDIVMYKIQAGDVLSAIAKKFDVSINAIIEENNLEDPERLYIGQELRIPLGTPTPLPTSTAIPTPTPTSGPPLPAPTLLGPVDGETITEDSVLLNWSSVAILGDDEWYLIQLWNGEPPDGIFVAEEWTQTTSWRVPATVWEVEGVESPQFYWSVIVAHRLEGDDETDWSWEAMSSESEVRTFVWPLNDAEE